MRSFAGIRWKPERRLNGEKFPSVRLPLGFLLMAFILLVAVSCTVDSWILGSGGRRYCLAKLRLGSSMWSRGTECH